jgi:hypothetical protein
VEVGVHLTTVGSAGEADVICALLRSAGIECGDREATGVWIGLLAHGGWREILVAEADLEAARELLESASPRASSGEA